MCAICYPYIPNVTTEQDEPDLLQLKLILHFVPKSVQCYCFV